MFLSSWPPTLDLGGQKNADCSLYSVYEDRTNVQHVHAGELVRVGFEETLPD